MAKIFDTSQDILDLANELFEETLLPQMGISLRVLSVTKAKQIVKASRANATLQHVAKTDVLLTIYEEAFDRLTDLQKREIMEGAISNISYDTNKDKLNVESDFAKEVFRMRKKYDNYVDVAELSYEIVTIIEDEEKRKKEEEKLRKAEERAAKKRNQGG